MGAGLGLPSACQMARGWADRSGGGPLHGPSLAAPGLAPRSSPALLRRGPRLSPLAALAWPTLSARVRERGRASVFSLASLPRLTLSLLDAGPSSIPPIPLLQLGSLLPPGRHARARASCASSPVTPPKPSAPAASAVGSWPPEPASSFFRSFLRARPPSCLAPPITLPRCRSRSL